MFTRDLRMWPYSKMGSLQVSLSYDEVQTLVTLSGKGTQTQRRGAGHWRQRLKGPSHQPRSTWDHQKPKEAREAPPPREGV